MATALPAPQGSIPNNSARTARPVPLPTVIAGFCLIEVALWTPKSIQLWVGLIAAAWIIGSSVLSRRSANELGLGQTGFRESVWIVAAALLTAGLLVSIGWVFGWLHVMVSPVPIWTHALAYSVWAFQQEFILQSFLYLNLLPVLGNRRAIWTAAIIFSACHLPNPILMAATLISGLALTAGFARYRNVYTIAIAHAVLGLAVAVSLPADLHRNMRVGLGYFTYHSVASAHSPAPLDGNTDGTRR